MSAALEMNAVQQNVELLKNTCRTNYNVKIKLDVAPGTH